MKTAVIGTTVRTEFAVRRTWPDGHTEVSERGSRADAELRARLDNRDQRTDCTAVVVSRTVTVTEWAEVQS